MESKSTTVKLVYIATLVAISFIGSLIKIQGTIALDSMAGFFTALFLGPISGALVGSMGHLLTAITSGFPLTLPIHLIITLQMAVFVYIFGRIYERTNEVVASIVAIILNGIVAVIMLAPVTIWMGLPLSGKAFIYAMVGPLTLASAVNIILASVIYKIIKGRI
jgi:uncharacterized membrane protein